MTRTHLPTVGVFGATGLVGEELLRLLAERSLPLGQLRLFASRHHEGAAIKTPWGPRTLEGSGNSERLGLDLAFLATPTGDSAELAPRLVGMGCTVIDCSSAFRRDHSVPLVVPEINGGELDSAPRLVSSPNCTTTIASMALDPIRRVAGLARVSMCTYQAVSGAGRAALEELDRQISEFAAGRRPSVERFPAPIHGNLFCHESGEDEFGENEEERKIREESRRILGLPELAISATCVRVPVRRAHSIAISFETERATTLSELWGTFESAAGIARVASDSSPEATRRLTPLDAEGRDEILVGRLRPDRSGPDGRAWSLFAVGDQLRKGAALNAVQIAEAMSLTPKLTC